MFASIMGIEKIPVLLVEDSPSEARIIQSLMDNIDEEYKLLSVATLEEAFDELSHQKVGAVIMDLGLPGYKDTQSVRVMGEHYPDLPIVVLSGRNDPVTVRDALEYGAQEFLSKSDCSDKMIRRALRNAIFRKSMTRS